MATLATLAIDLTANSAQMVGELNKANKNLDGFAQSAETAGRVIKTAFVAATTGMFANMVKESVDAADRMGKLSQRLGASTEALSELQHVADLSGVSFNTMTMGLQRMTRRVSEAANGTGEAKKALEELGMSAQSLNQLAPEKQFEVIADALAGVSNEGDRVRLAMKFFDSEGVALVQTMGDGAEGIRKMREEARRLGLTLSQEGADAAAAFNDEVTRAQATLNGLAKEIAINSVTAFNTLTEAFGAVGDQAADSAPDLSGIQDIIKGAGAAAFVAFNTVQALSEGIVSLGFAVAEVLSGNFSNALSELEVGFERMKGQLDEALEGVDRLYNVSGQFPGGDGEGGEAPSPFAAIAPNIVQDTPAGEGGEDVDPLKRILGSNPDEVLERLESQLMTEEESIVNAYTRRQQILNDHLAQNEDFEAKHRKLTLKNLAKFQKDYENAQKKGNKGEEQTAEQHFRSILAGTIGHNEAIQKIQAAFAIKDALVNAYRGISLSLASYPMPQAAVFAAAHAGVAFANISNLRSVISGSGGGGGGGSSISATVPALDTTDTTTETFGAEAEEAPVQKVVTIAVEGVDDDALLTKNQLRQVVDQINEEASANVRINV